jgi:hypothetical protein
MFHEDTVNPLISLFLLLKPILCLLELALIFKMPEVKKSLQLTLLFPTFFM